MKADKKQKPSRDDPSPYAAPEQPRYARVLEAWVRAGFFLLVLSFVLYMLEVPKPLIPLDQLPQYWGLSVDEFVRATHAPTGWAWLAMIGHGDMLNLVGIAVLAGAPALASIAVLPVFARRGEYALLVVALLQLMILLISASNLLAGR